LTSNLVIHNRWAHLNKNILVQAAFTPHTVCRRYFYQRRHLKSVKNSLTREALNSLIQAFVHCRLDYCNSALAGVAKFTFRNSSRCRVWLLVWWLEQVDVIDVIASLLSLRTYIGCLFRAGSSIRLVRLKPQGPGPDRGPDRPVQRKFTK